MFAQILFILSLVVIHSLSVLLQTHYIVEEAFSTDAGLYLATSDSGTLFLDRIVISDRVADCYFRHSRLCIESEPSGWTLWLHIQHLTEESLKSFQLGIACGVRLLSSEWFSLTLYLKLENLQRILWTMITFKLGVILLLAMNYYKDHKTIRNWGSNRLVH